MNFYHHTVPQFVRLLGQVPRFLDKAQAYAEQKKFDPEVLLNMRLAPDQFHLTRQVQVACDSAKFVAARLTGVEAPAFEDNESTIAELRERVAKTITWLQSLTPEQFEGGEERKVVLPFVPGKYLTGAEYLIQFALPNFYFHLATAYAILRHNGVDVGKMDFLGPVTFHDM